LKTGDRFVASEIGSSQSVGRVRARRPIGCWSGFFVAYFTEDDLLTAHSLLRSLVQARSNTVQS
jgi:hypothetical protein